ncbi:MAG: ABC transporter ATP-binding protein [Cardiobacteriaceae bacterium]|nr:ABC transporter ATP-binding protein [Cardiobacteriaceae bacterium]
MSEKKIVLAAENISFSYKSKDENLQILKNLNLEVKTGEKIAIIGASGTGKSTLLHILAGLDTPEEGKITLCGENFVLSNKKQHNLRAKLRNKYMGFVYQFHHLLAEFSAVENVALPLLIRGVNNNEAQKKAAECLERVGLKDRMQHKPAELSGGERQRAAIARALVGKPACLLADEPTGNLDTENSASVFALMSQLVVEENSSLIMVTHDVQLAKKNDRCLRLEQGKLLDAGI